MILVTADITGLERRRKAIREAHKAKREFARVVSEELPRAILAETKFRDEPIDPSKGIRAALRGGHGAIRSEDDTADGLAVTVGIEYAKVPHWRVENARGDVIIRAKRAKNLTAPANDRAALALYKAGSVRNIPGLEYAVLGGRPALVKEGSDAPEYWLKKSVKKRGKPYVDPGVERFRRTAWRQLAATLPGMIVGE